MGDKIGGSMKYNVHVYCIVRVLVPAVEAKSSKQACRRADVYKDLRERLARGGEYTGDVEGYLVDVVDDKDHEDSRFYSTKEVWA